MNDFDRKINDVFPGLVVRKDLVKEVKGNAIVPSYVLEYLLGQYCASDDEETVKSGIENVKAILAEHYVHRNEANKVRSEINEKGQKKVIDIVSVTFNEKEGTYEASFSNLGINRVIVDPLIVKNNEKLLVHGVWCISTVSYFLEEGSKESPWHLENLKPIQLSSFNFEEFKEGRKNFTVDEWLDLIMQSIGFNPDQFSKRMKMMHLLRLIPFVERNYNLVELGPKGTGKSHIYSEFSPYGMLLSGGEVTVAKLFVNNSNGRIGLVGYWDNIAFDEFAGQGKKVDKALVDIMKNYMANKSFSRGIETLGAEASMSFVGNTKHIVPYMLKHSDLFEELPSAYHDSAFIDRIHAFIPGWEFDSIRSEMFSSGYGFIVDYMAEMFRFMRNFDFSDCYKNFFTLSDEITTRDKDGINKTFSGLMKILFPAKDASKEEIRELLEFAIEHRKRVKDQLVRIDATFEKVKFSYIDKSSAKEVQVKVLEEKMYPELYDKSAFRASLETVESSDSIVSKPIIEKTIEVPLQNKVEELPTGHVCYPEGITGVSYSKLFSDYLKDATIIDIQDPYIMKFHQIRNMAEFLEMLLKHKLPENDIQVNLVTKEDMYNAEEQFSNLMILKDNAALMGIDLNFSFDEDIHARSIIANNGWKIILDRGLDIFQNFSFNDQLSFASRLQEARKCKQFEVVYMKEDLI